MSETEFQYQSKSTPADRGAEERAKDSSPPPCPFRDGPLSLDLLLGEVGDRDVDLLDAILDLRSLMHRREDAWALLEQLYRVRRQLNGRCHLALYRVRCWVKREIVAEVRRARGQPWLVVPLPWSSGNLNEAINTCLARLVEYTEDAGAWDSQVRFRFAR